MALYKQGSPCNMQAVFNPQTRKHVALRPFRHCISKTFGKTTTMNTFVLLVLLLVVLVGVTSGMPQRVVRTKKRFPGERTLGKTNYGTHSFGERGYKRNSNPRKRG